MDPKEVEFEITKIECQWQVLRYECSKLEYRLCEVWFVFSKVECGCKVVGCRCGEMRCGCGEAACG